MGALNSLQRTVQQQAWQRNLTLLNSIAFSRMFLLIMPIFVPLMSRYGLTMQQTMLLQSVFAGSVLLCELPSGYLSDLWGRKQVLMIGSFLAGLGFSVLFFAGNFWQLALFEILLGLSWSLISGTDTSMAFESEQALEKPVNGKAIAHQLSWMHLGEAIAAGLTTLLMLKGYNWVLTAQLLVGWIPFALCFGLKEPPRTPSNLGHRENGRQVWQILSRDRQIPVLAVLFLGVMTLIWLVAWLNQPLWLSVGLDPFWFGIAWGGECLVIGIAARYAHQFRQWLKAVPVWWPLAGLMLTAWLFLYQSATLAGLLTGAYLSALLYSLAVPCIKEDINQLVDSTYRATINSVLGTLFRVGNLCLGPILGWLVDTRGAGNASQWLLLLVAPTALLLLWWGKAHRPVSVAANEAPESV